MQRNEESIPDEVRSDGIPEKEENVTYVADRPNQRVRNHENHRNTYVRIAVFVICVVAWYFVRKSKEDPSESKGLKKKVGIMSYEISTRSKFDLTQFISFIDAKQRFEYIFSSFLLDDESLNSFQTLFVVKLKSSRSNMEYMKEILDKFKNVKSVYVFTLYRNSNSEKEVSKDWSPISEKYGVEIVEVEMYHNQWKNFELSDAFDITTVK